MSDTAAAQFAAHLQVGRVLSGGWLTAAVLVRNMAVTLLTATIVDTADWYAPSWVVVTRISDGKPLGRVAVGRQGDGAALLSTVRDSLNDLSGHGFLDRWDLR